MPFELGHLAIEIVEVRVDTRASSNAEIRSAQNALRIPPGRKIAQRIFTHEEDEGIGKLSGAQRFQGIHRVGWPVSLDLNTADAVVRRVLQGKLEHGQAILVAADDLPQFVRWATGGRPDNTIQLERLAQAVRNVQVADMDGIEGSTEDTNSIRGWRSCHISTGLLPREIVVVGKVSRIRV